MMARGVKAKMIGVRFTNATVLKEVVSQAGRKFNCQCDCGNTFTALGSNLLSGHTTSCGCYGKERQRKAVTKHGGQSIDASPEKEKAYRLWHSMRQRCNDPGDKDYPNYGKRGISICAEWDDFAVFLAHIGYPPSPEHQLDRIDNEGNYEPGNVRWATREEQSNNKRSNVHVFYKGKTQTLKQWARELNINYHTLHSRLRRGWSFACAVELPIEEQI